MQSTSLAVESQTKKADEADIVPEISGWLGLIAALWLWKDQNWVGLAGGLVSHGNVDSLSTR
jgi:hypothetical protein